MSKESRSIGGEGAADTTSDSGVLAIGVLALRRAPVLHLSGKMPCLH